MTGDLSPELLRLVAAGAEGRLVHHRRFGYLLDEEVVDRWTAGLIDDLLGAGLLVLPTMADRNGRTQVRVSDRGRLVLS